MRGALLLFLFCAAACHQPWRVDPPVAASKVAVRIPAYEHRTLANGVQVYLQPDAYLPLVSVQLVVRAGEAAVPQQQAGLMRVLYEMLCEDAELAHELDLLGASLKLGVRPDGAVIAVNVASADALRAVQVLAKALREPRLDEATFSRVRTQRLAAIFSQTPSPEHRAADALLAAIYGPAHPIAAAGRKTITPLSQLQLDDVKAAYRRFIGPKNVALVMVGRVPQVVGFAWAQKFLGDWSVETEEPAVAPPLPPPPRQTVPLLPTAALPGTLVLIGGRIDWGNHADEAAIQAAVRFLGARISFGLRLKGYLTPGTDTEAEIEKYGFGAHYVLRTVVRPEFTRAALKEIERQLSGTLAIYLSANAGVEVHVRQIVFYLRLDSILHESSKLAEIATLVHSFRGLPEVGLSAALLHLQKLPELYYIQLLDRLNALTESEMKRAMDRYLSPATAHIVVAGDPAIIEPQLRGAELGAVQRLPLD